MKKYYSLLFASLSAGSLMAQLPVSQTPSNRKFVLEEFTGFKCTYCPDGHKIANQIIAANPNNAFAVNIHTTSSFSNPGAGQPDYRTPDGDAISNMPGMGIQGFPQGSCNRITYGGAMATSRNVWASNANTIIAQSSYVNVAAEATLDVVTRQLTINLQAYYTANSPQATNKFTVALLQNNINGPQTSGATNPANMNPDGTYRHMHMLRDVLTTSALGDNIPTTTAGTLFTQTINYTVPANYSGIPAELADLEILVFVTETDKNIMTAAKAPISYTGFTTTNDAALANLIDVPETCGSTITPFFKLKNLGSANITSAAIEYSVNGGTPQTFNFVGNIGQLQSQLITLSPITYTLQPSNTLNIEVLSVNGNVDDNAANNTATETFAETSAYGNTVNLKVLVVQDQYGSETTWKIKNEAGLDIASGGPYPNLSGAGTAQNVHNVLAPATGCYTFEILDSYGDGLNSGFGAGSAKVTDGTGHIIYTTNGVFTDKVDKQFKVNSSNNTTAGVEEIAASHFEIYPNPAHDKINVSFEATGASYEFTLTDMQGRQLMSKELKSSNGLNTLELPVSELSTGNYLLKIQSGGQSYTRMINKN